MTEEFIYDPKHISVAYGEPLAGPCAFSEDFVFPELTPVDHATLWPKFSRQFDELISTSDPDKVYHLGVDPGPCERDSGIPDPHRDGFKDRVIKEVAEYDEAHEAVRDEMGFAGFHSSNKALELLKGLTISKSSVPWNGQVVLKPLPLAEKFGVLEFDTDYLNGLDRYLTDRGALA